MSTEVDFLLRRGREYLAVEVKSQDRFAMSMATGLRAIGDLRGIARRVLVYRGARSLKTEDGIEVWPFERFDAAVAAGRLWPWSHRTRGQPTSASAWARDRARTPGRNGRRRGP